MEVEKGECQMKKVLGMHVHPFREGDKERYGLELKFTDKFSFYLRYPAVLQIVTETGNLSYTKRGMKWWRKGERVSFAEP